MARTLIGCSGWSYKDWVGPFYPKDSKPKDWLDYYGLFFPTVEINSTYYAVPNRYTVGSWVRKGLTLRETEHGKNFTFSVKLNHKITHDHMVNGNLDDVVDQTQDFIDKVLTPLGDSEILGAVLVQFSPYFRFDGESGQRNLEALDTLFDELGSDNWEVATEFRHRSWTKKARDFTNILVPEAMTILDRHNVILVQTDGPSIPSIEVGDAKRFYIRFHGRNENIWFIKGSGAAKGMDQPDTGFEEAGSFNRYDYLYTKDELTPWSQRLNKDRSVGGYVYFNNHPKGKGPKNALMMMDLLGITHEPKDIMISSQQRLF